MGGEGTSLVEQEHKICQIVVSGRRIENRRQANHLVLKFSQSIENVDRGGRGPEGISSLIDYLAAIMKIDLPSEEDHNWLRKTMSIRHIVC